MKAKLYSLVLVVFAVVETNAQFMGGMPSGMSAADMGKIQECFSRLGLAFPPSGAPTDSQRSRLEECMGAKVAKPPASIRVPQKAQSEAPVKRPRVISPEPVEVDESIKVPASSLCAFVDRIDKSSCQFISFAAAENISSYKKSDNRLLRGETASVAFNQLEISCPGSSKSAAVCFGTIECQLLIQDDCSSSKKSTSLGSVRAEMSVACTLPAGNTCQTVSAENCLMSDDKVQAVEVDAKIRRVGNSNVRPAKDGSK
jgi:hypothetical protein